MNDNYELCNELKAEQSFPPRLPEINTLESLSSSKNPSHEGAWWIMFQTAMSCINHAALRDPVNNLFLNEFWHEAAEKKDGGGIAVFLGDGKNKIRPLPYDDIMQLINYCGKQLQYVTDNPKHSIVKKSKMVPPYRAKNMGTKTMDWLGKQPGKTIKEKLSGKNKMLTLINEYSYDIKENQAALMLYNLIMKRVSARITNGIQQCGYDELSESPQINEMLRLKKSIRKSEINKAVSRHHTTANNALLSDKNYSVIWKAYLKVCKYDENISKGWNKAHEMFVKSCFISFNALLTQFNEVKTAESRVNLSEKISEEVIHILGWNSVSPCILKLSNDGCKINMKMTAADAKERKIIKEEHLELLFAPDYETNLAEKRGYPLKITNSEEDFLSIYADNEGLFSFIKLCISKAEAFSGHSFTLKKHCRQSLTGTCTFDIASGGTAYVNNEKIEKFYDNTAVVYVKNGSEKICTGNPYSLYPGAERLIKISDAVKSGFQTEALKSALDEFSRSLDLAGDDYFIYEIPDSLEEFSQKNLKTCVNSVFPRTFPIWRSVAALTNSAIKNKKYLLNPNGCLFISADLTGNNASAGLLRLDYDENIEDFICSHYPPLPQYHEGISVTDKAFMKRYIKLYFDKNSVEYDESLIEAMSESDDLKNFFETKKSCNYITISGGRVAVYRIEYDRDTAEQCKSEWLEDFKVFFEKVCSELNMAKTRYINVLTDCINNFLSEREISLKLNNNIVYFSRSAEVNSGAYVYIDRLRNNLPTWTEYLPELSLEVIRNGTYDRLNLIGKDVKFDVMGRNNSHIVKEKLFLKAGEKEFRFPLIKNDVSRNSLMIEALITDKSFPLDHDIEVSLTVNYKYGFDNSYELILKPADKNEKAFRELTVKWTNKAENSDVINIWPPETNLQPEENVLREIEITKNSLSKTAEYIYNNVVCYRPSWGKYTPASTICKYINQTIFKLRNITLSSLPEAKEFIDWFLNSDIYMYLAEFSKITRPRYIPSDFYKDCKPNDLAYLRGDSLQVILSAGGYTWPNIQKFFTLYYDKFDEIPRIKAAVNLMLKNNDKQDIINNLINDVKNNYITDDPSDYIKNYNIKMYELIRALGKLCCFDSDLIYDFFDSHIEFAEEIIYYITEKLTNLLKEFEDPDVSFNRQSRNSEKLFRKQQKSFVIYMEAILSMLRLRNPEKAKGFEILKIGSGESLRLAEIIKRLDVYTEHPSSKVRFNLEKPENLSKMSDLAYALVLYLNGDKKAALIEVAGLEEE